MLHPKDKESRLVMTVTTNVQDVLPDGTITKLSFTVAAVCSVMLSRTNVDEAFKIESFDPITDNEQNLSEAIEAIRSIMLEHEIDIIIPVANRKTR